jgi:hypothetical protein
MIGSAAAVTLAASLSAHPALTHLLLEHNPLLDKGGAAVASILPTTHIATLSLAFTGVADRTCDALAAALRGRRRRRAPRGRLRTASAQRT